MADIRDAVTQMVPTGATTTSATPQERIDFLKYSIAFTEHTIRSYDTKAQIALAAFLFSLHPLWTILTATCAAFALRPEAVAVSLMFIITILLYCFVLWPMRPPAASLTSSVPAKDLFYIRDPLRLGITQYMDRLNQMSVEPELAAEVFKLAWIRRGKHRRLNTALSATFVFYAVVVAVFFLTRASCA